MPELPEVETVVRGLRPRLVGRTIERVEIRQSPRHGLVRGNIPRFRRTLRGAVIARVGRIAKYILVDLGRSGSGGEPATWVVHLGMSGQLYACRPEAERLKHTHLVLTISSGEQLRLCDPRRFGRTMVLRANDLAALLARTGPDPLEITPEAFSAMLAGRKAPIKNLLLNQTLLGGVGNIYANEALFLAGIHPAHPAGLLTFERVSGLHGAIQQVLREAIADNGTTVADYRTAEGVPGGYQNRLRVYDRAGEPCPRCGAAIRRLVQVGRSSHYCPACQRKPRKRKRRERLEPAA